MRILIELADQDYKYCLDYASGKTNTIALNNIKRIIKAIANGTPQVRVDADGYGFRELSNNICTQKCCLKNHNVGIIECNEEYCLNRTKF